MPTDHATLTSPAAMIKLVNVTARYGEQPVLRDVSLSVQAGEIVCILGPNGSGKSTLLHLIAGVVDPSAGSIMLCGRDRAELTRSEVARLVALVAQRAELAPGFTVDQVIAMGRAPHQGAWLRASKQDEQQIGDAISACNLEPLSHRQLNELSGGELARVHLARALCQQTPIMLLDEVAAHLDVRHAVDTQALLRQQVTARGLACVTVMHDLNTAARHADRVILLKEGAIVADGPPAEVMNEDQLAAVFGTSILSAKAIDGRPYFVAARG